MRIEAVYFNHDPAAATSDALTIRRNAGGAPIAAPEWRRGYRAAPAAYAVAPLGATVTIRARFSGGPPGGSLRIRAIDAYVAPADPGGCLGWLFVLIAQLIRALFGNVLGNVAARTVTFDLSGNSAVESFTLTGHRLKTSGVGVRQTEWHWQAARQRRESFLPLRPTWTTFDTTRHTIYVVLDVPRGPWTQGGGNDTQLPWVDALDKACAWAVGAKTGDAAAAAITRSINTHPRQTYTPATIFGFGTYNLSSYMTHLDGPATFALNCTDCADAVTTFANLLGCDLWEGRFFDMVTRKFLTLNGNPAAPGDWVSWSWGYHEICWLGGITQLAPIYDGCLQLDMDDDYGDSVHVAQHPIRMPFGTTDPAHYRYRLIASGSGNLENVPRRRAVY